MEQWPHQYWNLITYIHTLQWEILTARKLNWNIQWKSPSFPEQITPCNCWSPQWEHFNITHAFLLAEKRIEAIVRFFAHHAHTHTYVHTLLIAVQWCLDWQYRCSVCDWSITYQVNIPSLLLPVCSGYNLSNNPVNLFVPKWCSAFKH